jgi:hypothetical protein
MLCDKLFPTEQSVENHQRNSRCPKQYKCVVCSTYFFKKTHCDVHIKDCIMDAE